MSTEEIRKIINLLENAQLDEGFFGGSKNKNIIPEDPDEAADYIMMLLRHAIDSTRGQIFNWVPRVSIDERDQSKYFGRVAFYKTPNHNFSAPYIRIYAMDIIFDYKNTWFGFEDGQLYVFDTSKFPESGHQFSHPGKYLIPKEKYASYGFPNTFDVTLHMLMKSRTALNYYPKYTCKGGTNYMAKSIG